MRSVDDSHESYAPSWRLTNRLATLKLTVCCRRMCIETADENAPPRRQAARSSIPKVRFARGLIAHVHLGSLDGRLFLEQRLDTSDDHPRRQ